MFKSILAAVTFFAFSLASPISTKRQVSSFVYSGDAPFTVDAATLAASLSCPYGNPTSSKPPVLLVHGTTATGNSTWGQGYVPALFANGYTPCYVTLPGRAMGDMQVSAEYVAYNLHYLSTLSGGLQTAVLGHSQGNPNTQWALRFWPSTRSVTSMFIALCPDFTGIDLISSEYSDLCEDLDCEASIWQQATGSNYYAALHYEDFEALVPTTAIWTEFDGVVVPPQENAELPSATTISVQDLCPLRLTNHVTMPMDSAGFALAMDALTHDGMASAARVEPDALSICFETTAPDMDPTVGVQLQDDIDSLIDGIVLGEPRLSAEPAVMAYALPANQ